MYTYFSEGCVDVFMYSMMGRRLPHADFYLLPMHHAERRFGLSKAQVRTQNFSLGGGGFDPEAIYNLCLILKTML
jgi:hypothetical protein